MEKIITLMSGGIDSFLMTSMLKENYNIQPLYVNYIHLAYPEERNAVIKQIDYLELLPLIEVSVDNISQMMVNSLTVKDEFKNDFYPARNLLLLVLASQIAYSRNISRIAIGIIKGSRIFPDCTDNYISKVENLMSISINKEIIIFNPLSNFSKEDVVTLFTDKNLPLNLVYSCQKGNKGHCGLCPSCIELFKEINGIRRGKNGNYS